MPKIHRKARRQRREWHDGHFMQLNSGWDFFHDAWGDLSKVPMDQRDSWPTPEILADMRECWATHREAVIAVSDFGQPVWAVIVLDQGGTHEDYDRVYNAWAVEHREKRRLSHAEN